MSTSHALFDVSTFFFSVFFFNDTATTEIYTLSLHDALPICRTSREVLAAGETFAACFNADAVSVDALAPGVADRKSTRLNSSHSSISYAVFCLKKKKQIEGSIRR